MMELEKVIEIVGLSFSYPDGHKALQGVNLVIYRGETVALIGPNGAGKSSLLLHLNGLYRSDGSVKVFNLPVEGKNLRQIRMKVGLVFQEPDDQLFCPTVFDDVAFGPINMGLSEEEVRQRVEQALSWVGMAGFEGRSSHHLSVGEKRRIALATVLSMNPELLVLDEPTSGLDPRGKWDLIRLLQGLPMTKLVASHDLQLVQTLCQRTIILDDGRLVADGPTERILSDLSLLEAHGLAPLGERDKQG